MCLVSKCMTLYEYALLPGKAALRLATMVIITIENFVMHLSLLMVGNLLICQYLVPVVTLFLLSTSHVQQWTFGQ